VKFSAKFLLASVFVFLPAVCCAQDDFGLLLGQISKVQRQCQDGQFELELKLQNQQRDIANLAKRQDALEKNLENAKFDIEFLKSMRGFADSKADESSKRLDAVESRLHETEQRLATAEETIQRLTSKPSRVQKPPANKPKAPVNKPAPAREGTRQSRRSGAVTSTISAARPKHPASAFLPKI